MKFQATSSSTEAAASSTTSEQPDSSSTVGEKDTKHLKEKFQQLHLEPSEPSTTSLSESRAAARSSTSTEDAKLAIYVRLFEHASACPLAAGCTSRNCSEMKKHLQHARVCRAKVQGGCRICKRIWKLLQVHASQCTDSQSCTVPQCASVQQKMKIMSQPKQQQPPNQEPGATSTTTNNNPSMICPPTAAPEASTTDTDTNARIRVVEHALACADIDCSFAGCAHTKRCLLRRRSRPGTGILTGCRTCQSIYKSLQQSNPALANSVAGYHPLPSSSLPSPGKRASKKIVDPPTNKRSKGPNSQS